MRVQFDHERAHFGIDVDGGTEVDHMWQRVDQPEVLGTIQELELAARKALLFDRRPCWCCTLCRNYEGGIRYIKRHLKHEYVSTSFLLWQLRRGVQWR